MRTAGLSNGWTLWANVATLDRREFGLNSVEFWL